MWRQWRVAAANNRRNIALAAFTKPGCGRCLMNQGDHMNTQKITFHVESRRIDEHGSVSRCKNAEIALDTDLAGNPDAFNPAELLLAALSACMIKCIERAVPMLK